MEPQPSPNKNPFSNEPSGQNPPPHPTGEEAGTRPAADKTNGSVKLDLLLDIPVSVSIELGRTELLLGEILQLGQGSVVELDKLAGEPFEVLVQGRPIGKGEVVVVNEKFGLRLTDILSPVERIEKLR